MLLGAEQANKRAVRTEANRNLWNVTRVVERSDEVSHHTFGARSSIHCQVPFPVQDGKLSQYCYGVCGWGRS